MASPISLNCGDESGRLQRRDGDPPINIVPWIDGFYGNVCFYEWEDFEDKVLTASTAFHQTMKRKNIDLAAGFFEVAHSVSNLRATNSSTCITSCSAVPISQMFTLSAALQVLRNEKRSSLHLSPANLLQPGPLTRWKALSAQLTSDWTTVFLAERTIPNNRWICAFNLLSPKADVLASEDDNSTARVSARELCIRYNALFNRRSKDIKNNEHSNSITFAAAIVAQALSGALSTNGGCVFLYNREVGVALKIVRNYNDKVVVKVSRPFYRDKEADLIAAIVALSVYSMNRISANSTAPAQMAERAEKIALSADIVRGVLHAPKRTTRVQREALEASPRKRVRRSLPGETRAAVVLRAHEARALQPRVLLNSGNSGRVFLSTWNGKGVAIKEWNGSTQGGLDCMLEEVAIINVMRTAFTDLKGTVIPNILLADKGAGYDAKSSETDGPIIVTEYVGETISRDSKRHLHVGDSPNSYAVKGSDERQIYEAAMKGLEKLHGKGLLHGSVNLRNLRVERRFDLFHATWKWKVWWIDFGRSQQLECDPEDKRFKDERNKCSKLFWTRSPRTN